MGTISCVDVRKRFKRIEAVCGISLLVKSGEVAALIGPNGAGKSTLMKMMVGLVKPDSGTVEVGKNADGDCGFMIEEPSFYPHLSGLDNLSIIASLFPPSRKPDVNWALSQVGLSKRAKDRYATYSLGMRQRLYFALAIMSRPSCLVLDEPFNGVDPITVMVFERLIREMAEDGAAVLVSSHEIRELQSFVDSAYMIDRGRIVYSTSDPKGDDLFARFVEFASSGEIE